VVLLSDEQNSLGANCDQKLNEEFRISNEEF
jgi:hypothetical protein